MRRSPRLVELAAVEIVLTHSVLLSATNRGKRILGPVHRIVYSSFSVSLSTVARSPARLAATVSAVSFTRS
ncbi:MAG: hypothetical protein H0X71_01690 [Rubrobacter sp.]|nr:hypothetical protein [Rubrobacter sp.]